MKLMRLRLFSLLLLVSPFAKSQNVELSFGAGIASYYGDLIQADHPLFQQPSYAFSVGAEYYFTPHWTVRGDFSVLKVQAADSKNQRDDLKARKLSFKSGIWDLGVMGQYNFIDITSGEHKITPYAFLGAGIFHFNPYTTDRNGNKVYLREKGTEGQNTAAYPDRKAYKSTMLNLPFGI